MAQISPDRSALAGSASSSVFHLAVKVYLREGESRHLLRLPGYVSFQSGRIGGRFSFVRTACGSGRLIWNSPEQVKEAEINHPLPQVVLTAAGLPRRNGG